jgi:hypothetical protein
VLTATEYFPLSAVENVPLGDRSLAGAVEDVE